MVLSSRHGIVNVWGVPKTDADTKTDMRLHMAYRTFVKNGARGLMALVALYVCFYLLQFPILLPSLRVAGFDHNFKLQVQGPVRDDKGLTITGEVVGQVPPQTTVTLIVGARKYSGVADPRGEVRIPVRLPDIRMRIPVTALLPGKQGVFYESLTYEKPPIPDNRPPVIELAMASVD